MGRSRGLISKVKDPAGKNPLCVEAIKEIIKDKGDYGEFYRCLSVLCKWELK